MKKIVSILVAIALVAFLIYTLTYHKKVIPAEAPGKVLATGAYEKYFGAAPKVDKGTAYAFVIYFPSGKEPGKVVPFPFFTFDEASMKRLAVERLLGGMDIGSYAGQFVPFPSGVRLIAIDEAQGTVTVNFSRELAKSTEAGTARAVGLTLRQFRGVKDVRLQVEGKESELSSIAKKADDTAVQQLSAPRLLSLTAMRDKGAREIEELSAFFDRPVEIKELKMLSENGQQFAGEIYHSVFDMAAVLRPKEPSQFKERMPINVRWKVVDKLGREAEGDSILLLEIKEH